MSGRAVPRKKPTPSSISRSPASIARPRPANSSTPPSRLRPTAWSPPRPWRPSCCANGAASPARPQILGDLFDRLGLRRIRAARLGQQPDGLRLELRRVSRSFCHGSPSSPIELGEMRNKNQFISDRAVVRERQAIPGDQGRVRHRAIDPAAPGPRHPRQRLHPGRGQPHARAERADRAGETQQAVGDGGGRFRTSGAGIRTKAGVIRANAARYPISARCGIPGVPRSACYWMTGHPEAERADPIAGDVRAVRRDGRERYGARKIKAALERRGVTASRRRIGGIMREQGMTGAYARGRSEPHRTRADEAGLANLPDPRVRRLRPAHASGGRPGVREGRERMGVRVSAGRPGGQGHRRPCLSSNKSACRHQLI